MKYVITEAERREILGLYDVKRPLQILTECKFTTDGKFVIYDGIAYSCETGGQVPINEAWTLSDTLHTIGDVASGVADYVVPGSGAIIDGVNAISYFIEAAVTKDPQRKHSLEIMGGITLAFALIPGVLQGVSIPLKQFVKGDIKAAESPLVAKGVGLIGKSMGKIITTIPAFLKRILDSNLGKRILGRYGEWLSKYIGRIMEGVKESFDAFAKAAGKVETKTGAEVGVQMGGKMVLNPYSKRALQMFTKAGDNLTIRGTGTLLRKIGFGVGKSYRYMGPKGMTTIMIKEITEDGIIITGKEFGQASVKTASFLNRSVGAPWLRRGKSVAIPFFVKRLADVLLPDGSGIDENKLNLMPDTNPDQTSKESLGYVNDEVASYQGGQGSYTANPTVTAFQKGLMSLGYTLPQFGADGKFGPETENQLKHFQQDYQLDASAGKMDRTTTKTMVKALQYKNIQNMGDVENTLNAA
jgi:hypothetical protein